MFAYWSFKDDQKFPSSLLEIYELQLSFSTPTRKKMNSPLGKPLF